MATEKKTTAKKTTAKKAACKKTACKKTTKAAAVKHIGLVKNDPYLADYEDAIRGRHDHVLWKMGQLTNNGKITLSGVTSQNVAATIQNSGTLKLENISANVCDAKVQNGSITGSVVGDSSAYGFDLTAGGGRIRVSDSNDRNFLLSGKDALQQNAGAPQKLSLATQNGDVDVEFVR